VAFWQKSLDIPVVWDQLELLVTPLNLQHKLFTSRLQRSQKFLIIKIRRVRTIIHQNNGLQVGQL